jgi:ribosomal protein L37AE/L43A
MRPHFGRNRTLDPDERRRETANHGGVAGAFGRKSALLNARFRVETILQKAERNGVARPALPLGDFSAHEAKMTEKVGETVRDSADYRCEHCHQTLRMVRGALIQPCPHCGYDTFDIANPRFERRDGSLGPHEPG